MSDRDTFRAEQQERRQFGKAKQHEKRLENATYTAAEVKVLTETASKVAYELGRKDAGEEIALALEAQFGIGGWAKAAKAAFQHAASIARRRSSPASDATSDATSGVPRHPEVSEAPKAPQEPCGHPTCPCASQEAK